MMKLFGPISRIAIGLVSITIGLLLLVSFLGVLRDDVEMARQARTIAAEDLSIQLAVLLQKDDAEALKRTIDAISGRDGEILSVGLRRNSGDIMMESADHPKHWVPLKDARSTTTHVSVPIHAGKDVWGNVEMSFRPVVPKTWLGWVRHPLVMMLLTLVVGGFLLYYWYMRRVLEHLDPTKAIPDRVRKALDTLTEGVIVLDTNGRIVLANEAFRELHGADDKVGLSARKASEIPWLRASLGEREPDDHPWVIAMRDGVTVAGELLEFTHTPDGRRKAKLAASPITDGRGMVRGCLVSLNDVTELDRKNVELERTLSALEESRQKIEAQNEELKQLANIDPLTGCMNRRSFFETAEELIAKTRAEGGHICCLMTDIDKFKTFNDTYGHAVGDQVLVQVARVLKAALRPSDILCRYGGEEFVAVMPDMDADQAEAVLARLLQSLQQLPPEPGRRRIPSGSFSAGIAVFPRHGSTLEKLLSRADKALYTAKHQGRARIEQVPATGFGTLS
jgi:diguanylate cyclase (GGDEF)-like protein/PAS domain S-box-containing protein